jgi:hypothetical protein
MHSWLIRRCERAVTCYHFATFQRRLSEVRELSRDKDTTGTLFGAEDPPAVQILRAGAPSPFFLTCEHAGEIFPKRLGTLGLGSADLERHITYDIGAAAVARSLSQRLNAHLVLQTYSRLVVDCNRSPDAGDFITATSEDTEIPGNRDVTEQQAKARADEIFHPYHDTIATALDERESAERITVLVAVHSCTPVLRQGLRGARTWTEPRSSPRGAGDPSGSNRVAGGSGGVGGVPRGHFARRTGAHERGWTSLNFLYFVAPQSRRTPSPGASVVRM